jgi:hypothetical protein
MARKVNWRGLEDRRAKSSALRREMSDFRKRRVNPTSTKLATRFRGITRMGIVTHCWRYGPKLPGSR